VRLAEFGRVRGNFPRHRRIAAHQRNCRNSASATFRDELKLGDQVLVKVLAIEGNKIRLSRKAVLREQREKQQKEAAGHQG